jgi:hypothetical protein
MLTRITLAPFALATIGFGQTINTVPPNPTSPTSALWKEGASRGTRRLRARSELTIDESHSRQKLGRSILRERAALVLPTPPLPL